MKSARRDIVAMAALLLSAGIWSCGTSPKGASTPTNTNDNIQTIHLTEQALEQGLRDTLRFGRMRQGEVIAKQLRIVNDQSCPAVILRHATSCGCTTVRYGRKPIAIGESTTIDFEFNSRGEMGWQMKLLEFYFAENGSPLKIYIEAEVE